jgi:TonB-dependent starch-binding outer membrane protein SusC
MKKQLLVTFLIAFCFCVNVFAQDRKVSGKVTAAEDGSGLPGVTVQLKGSNKGTTTDASGNYSIAVPDKGVLKFSFVGLTSKEVTLNTQSVIDVQMTTDVQQLSEIVVTGVGTATDRRKLAFAVESVSGKNLPQAPTASIDQALVGKIAGAQISSTNGTPGAAVNIVLRGINTINKGTSPIILIDGIQVNTDLNAIDLNSIERVEVVQGAASATIYGAQGANGVIQLFTKKGKSGQLNIDFSSSVAQSDYLNIGGLHKAYNHNFATDASGNVIGASGKPLVQDPITGLYSENVVYNALDVNGQFNKPYTGNMKYYDHYKFFFVPANTYNNSLSITGGKDKFDFGISLSNNSQGSNIVNNGGYNRTNFMANLGTELAKGLKLRSITQVIYTKNTLKSDDRSIVYSINNTRPFANYETPDAAGNYTAYVGDAAGVNGFNPNFYQQYLDRQDNKIDVIQNLSLNYNVNKFLELDAKYGINYQREEDIYTYGNQTGNANIAALPSNYYLSGYGSDKKGEIDNFSITKVFQNFLATATIRTDFQKDFNLSVPITTTTQLAFDHRNQNNNQYVTYQLGLPTYTPFTPAQGTSSNTRPLSFSGTTAAPQGTYTEKFITYGFLVNQKFEYGDIGGISGGFRTDYSSAFGAGSTPFTFPRGDAYLRISQLDFWKDASIANTLSEFKIRAAYGKAGIQPRPFDRYVTLGTRNIGSSSAFYFPTAQANPDLNVEVSTETELGTDFGFNLGKSSPFFNDLRLGITYWKRTTDGAIWNVDAAPSTGAGTIKTNAFGIGSNGIQASINTSVIKKPDFSWGMTVNFSKQTSQITSVSGNGEIVIISNAGSTNYVLKAGEKIGQLYGFKAVYDLQLKKPDGTFEIPENQQSLYEVASNGFVVSKATKQPYFTADKYSFGDPNPAFNMSFINDFTYKGYLTAGFQLDWVQGSHIYNQTKEWMYRDGIHGDYDTPITIGGQTGAWTAFYRGVYTARGNNATKDYFYEDASFLRLRNVSVGVDLAKAFNMKTFRKLQLVLSGRNLLTFTKYTGFDPEVSSGANGSAWDRGTDHNTMPNTRAYQVSLNFGF